MKLNSSLLLSSIVFSLFAITTSCKDEEPKIYGGDGATLDNIDRTDGLALISVVDGAPNSSLVESDGELYFKEKLYKVNSDGNPTEVQFAIKGNANGGFDNYAINDINEKYFLISFYLRKESYFISKATGKAFKSAFIKVEDFLTIPEYIGYAVYGETNFYYRDIDNKSYSIENYTLENSVASELKMEEWPERFYTDDIGQLYYLSQSALYAYNNVLTQNGEIPIIPWLVNRNDFKVLNFPAQSKTIGIIKKNDGKNYLFNLLNNEIGLALSGDGINSINSFDKYYSILYTENEKTILMHIDVSNFSCTKTEIMTFSPVIENSLCVINDHFSILEVCEPGKDYCTPNLVVINKSGDIRAIFPQKASGKVIKL